MIDEKFLKEWGLSLLMDISFGAYIMIAAFVNMLLVGSLPLVKFISKYSLEEVTKNPSILPSKFVLYSGVILLLLIPLVLIVGGYLVFVLTRHWYYRRTLKHFWASFWRLILGLFLIFIPAYLVLAISSFVFRIISFGNEYVYQIVFTFGLSVLLILCGVYFIKAQKKKAFQAASDAYDFLFKNTKPILIGAGIITAASTIFMLFGTIVLSTRYLYQGFSSWWYILTSLLMISWLRVYVVSITEESLTNKIVKKVKKSSKKVKKAAKTTVKRARKKAKKSKKKSKK